MIETPCPSCGKKTLVLDGSKELICSNLGCDNPTLIGSMIMTPIQEASLQELLDEVAVRTNCLKHQVVLAGVKITTLTFVVEGIDESDQEIG